MLYIYKCFMRREILRKKWSCDLWMLVAHNYGAGRCHKILEYIKWTWRHASWFIYALYLQLDFKNERPLVRAWGSRAVTARAVTARAVTVYVQWLPLTRGPHGTWAPRHMGPHVSGNRSSSWSGICRVFTLMAIHGTTIKATCWAPGVQYFR